MDLLFDGIMIEVRPNPKEALIDASQQIAPAEYTALITGLLRSRSTLRTGEERAYFKTPCSRIDTQIIGLLGRRMAVARKLGIFKRRHGVSLFLHGRYEELRHTRVANGARLELAEEFVTRIYQHIHEENLRHQESASVAVARAGDPDSKGPAGVVRP